MENFCPPCQANGLKRRLVLFQLNLEEAILLCENKECVYPLGVTDNAELIVSRKASEVASFVNLKRRRRKRPKQIGAEEPENISRESTSVENILQWENVDCLCWLNSLLALLVHNATLITSLKKLVQNQDSLLRMLTESFSKAQELLSTNREQAKELLTDIREMIWKYLQPKMKCQRGVNDSPVTALPLLLREDSLVSERMLQVYQWEFRCSACGYQQIDKRKKHLVTFPNVAKDFSLQKLAFTRPCYRCGAPGQTSKLVYDRMPDCIVLHFEQGLNVEKFEDLDFGGENCLYVLSQFIQYKKNPDHFVCWIKEPQGRRWMELDDLKPPICSWSCSTPNVPLSEVHIAIWEKVSTAFNSLLPPATKEISTTELKTNFKAKLAQDPRSFKTSSMPLLSVDCNTSGTSSQDINKGILSPPLQSPMLSPSRGRTGLNLPLKPRSGLFEPYIPRKKRLVSQSCPNSPLWNNNSKADSDRNAAPLASPLLLSQPFLTWQDVKEQNKKLNVDDMQSDSGYSSPASVSSCGSLVTGQSNFATSVNEQLEDLPDNCSGKQNTGQQIDQSSDAVPPCNSYDSSSKGCLLHRSTNLMHEVDSLDLANKLEQLLPDCLLGNPSDLVENETTDAMETKLEDIGKLSAEQDQFILDLLAT